MAKVSVYLPDDLHRRVTAIGNLPVSAICQQALRSELDRQSRGSVPGEGRRLSVSFRLEFWSVLPYPEWLDVEPDDYIRQLAPVGFADLVEAAKQRGVEPPFTWTWEEVAT